MDENNRVLAQGNPAGDPRDEQAVRMGKDLPCFERDHGIARSEDRPGCRGDARRIAAKFVATTVFSMNLVGHRNH